MCEFIDNKISVNIVIECNGCKILIIVQGILSKFDYKKIFKVVKKEFVCNGIIISDIEMGEVIQFQGDQCIKIKEFFIDKENGFGFDDKIIKVCSIYIVIIY